MIACLFGNPYVVASMADVPAVLLTYDFGDLAEASALRALAGEIPIAGRLPVTIPGIAALGDGLLRSRCSLRRRLLSARDQGRVSALVCRCPRCDASASFDSNLSAEVEPVDDSARAEAVESANLPI
jgi:hypothetical protein